MNKYAGETIKQYQKVLNESDKEKQRDPSELRAEALLKEMVFF